MADPTDAVELTCDLMRCPSVTPAEAGAIALLQDRLTAAGFECHRIDRGGISNLFARWGAKGAARTFGYNGHTDVVPVGDEAAWTYPPFGAEDHDGFLYGRGAVDMKSGVAAFVAAAIDFVRDAPPMDGAIILTITGDEEGDAVDGTTAILDWMEGQGEAMSVCLVGEPTSREALGDMLKIGRRGSLSAWITATGVQGHSAYPQRAHNPLPALLRYLDQMSSHELDRGNAHFEPSTLNVVTVDTGNTATNVIPASATAALNIRFNDEHSGAGLSSWLESMAQEISAETGTGLEVKIKVSGESFLTAPGPLSDLVTGAVKAHTGLTPELSTTGGTSDARFVVAHCPVLEFGLVGKSLHAVDEHVEIAQIGALKDIYTTILTDYFRSGG